MRVVLITSDTRWTETLRDLLKPSDDFVSIVPESLQRNERLLRLADLVFIALPEEPNQNAVHLVVEARAACQVPIFVLCDRVQAAWEETLHVAGAYQVFTYPLRPKLIALALERARPRAKPGSQHPFPNGAATESVASTEGNAIDNGHVLGLLRELSRLLIHAGDGPLFLDSYLRKLREVLRSEHMILYLADAATADRRLRCSVAAGVDASAFSEIRLSHDEGVGGLLTQRSGLLQRRRLREDDPAQASAGRELDVFGAELAIPIKAREGLFGALLVGSRISGSSYTETELTLLFHLMEELGAITHNAELQSQLLRERHLFSSVLMALPVGCMVIDDTLRVIHSNSAARRLLATTNDLRFEDLPQRWASSAYEVMRGTKADVDIVLRHEVTGVAASHVRLRARRISDAAVTGPNSVVLTMEDVSAEITAQNNAVASTANALLARAGEKLATELNNALTPFHTITQLAREDVDGIASFSATLPFAMKRIQRRIDALAYLAPHAIIPEVSSLPLLIANTRSHVGDLLEEPVIGRVRWPAKVPDVSISVDVRAMTLAIGELVMNAVEASEGQPVELVVEDDPEGFQIRVINRGVWSAPGESGGFTHRPFMTEKATGIGLGLEVASRVAENHSGRLRLAPIAADKIEASIKIPHQANTPITQ